MNVTMKNQAERRRHPRTQLQMSLRALKMDPEGDSLETFYMMDISRSGIGALAGQAYYPGQRVVLNLPIPNQPNRRSVYATVVRCRAEQDGYRLGMMFDKTSISNFDTNHGLAAAA